MKSIITEKSFQFALEIVNLYKELKSKNEFILSKQILRSGTSVGANVEEANAGQSRKDFINKMSIALKEARESHYWLRLLNESKLVTLDYSKYLLLNEEIIKILTSIIKTSQENLKNP